MRAGDCWTCVCGHVYDVSADGNGKFFRDLPLEWPCPTCGQTRFDLWNQDYVLPPPQRLRRQSSGISGDSIEGESLRSPRPESRSHRLLFDTRSTECSSARSREYWSSAQSAGNCSGSFASECSSSSSSCNSWTDDYETHDISPAIHSCDEPARSRHQAEPDSTCVLAGCCCEDGHSLTLDTGRLWCPVCVMPVLWPVWPQVPPCESAGTVWTSPVPPEESTIIHYSGKLYRTGIGHTERPVRPGFQAGGGSSGPWWTRTDSKFLGR